MKTEKERAASRFLEMAESHLDESKKLYRMDKVTIPMSESDFLEILKIMEEIKTLGKEKNIRVHIENEEDAREEFGHLWCFSVERIK